MKTKKPKKEVNNSSAFSQLIEQVEKEKKRAKIICSVGIVVLALSLFSFFLFTPTGMNAYSQFRNMILRSEETQEELEEEGVEKKEEIEEIVEEEKVEEKEVETTEEKVETNTNVSTKPKEVITNNPEPEPEPEVRQFSCTEETMQGYVTVMCTNFSFIGQSEEHLTPSARVEAYNKCVSTNCSLVVNYPDLLMECQADCIDWVEEEVAYYEGSIQEYYSNIQYYSNLLLNCGWTVSEVNELKQRLENTCVYSG